MPVVEHEVTVAACSSRWYQPLEERASAPRWSMLVRPIRAASQTAQTPLGSGSWLSVLEERTSGPTKPRDFKQL